MLKRLRKLLTEAEKTELDSYPLQALQEAFHQKIEFGTAGMRGVMGVGPNRINRFTITLASYAFGKQLLKKHAAPKMVIAHDNRHLSKEFTSISATVFAKLGIKTYVFKTLEPTPLLSYAVRFLKCAGGVMITASHNTKEYNGYKVYDATGSQIIPKDLTSILKIYTKADLITTYKKLDLMPLKTEIITLNDEVEASYIEAVKAIAINKNLDKKGFKIVYTPLHGTGLVPVMRVLQESNYQVFPVLSQTSVDPNFSKTESPNPESPKAFIEAIKYAKELDADLILASDPDADRVGLAYKGQDQEYHLLTGNESASLLLEYILKAYQEQKLLPPNSVMFNSVVTSRIGKAIATAYGVKNKVSLTGFKYIGTAIHKEELKPHGAHFVFGYEESYGCLIKPFVRDKDAVQAILLYAEMTLYYLKQNKRLDAALEELYQKYHYYQADQISLTAPSDGGQEYINHLITSFRSKPIKVFDKAPLVQIDDYLLQTTTKLLKEQSKSLKTDPQNMIIYTYQDKSWLAIRPSGTEPKCKIYYEVVAKTRSIMLRKQKLLKAAIEDYIKSLAF
ncbi:MAG: phospho-sugar mutase [Erysipelotrichaceae bacterium]|jgi:phosphoglucomutase|nr:phospho-sugar mutase [Erysipelotrichaceae bacterium]